MAGSLSLMLDTPHTYQRRFTTGDIERLLRASHHYIVSRGPLVRVEACEPRDNGLVFTLDLGPARPRHNAYFSHPKYQGPMRAQLLGDGRYWVALTNTNQVITHGNAWTLACLALDNPRWLADQKVLYIGKSYGRKTRTSAIDRIKPGHEKLARIMEDYAGSQYYDIFVTPLVDEEGGMASAAIDDPAVDTATVLEFSGKNFWRLGQPRSAPGAEIFDMTHIKQSEAGKEHCVALVEEALIAYFKPEYNETLKEWGRTQTAAARAMLQTGLTRLWVTVSGIHSSARFWSDSVPEASPAHTATFQLQSRDTQPSGQRPKHWDRLARDAARRRRFECEHSAPLLTSWGSALPEPTPWGTRRPDEMDMGAPPGTKRRPGFPGIDGPQHIGRAWPPPNYQETVWPESDRRPDQRPWPKT